MLRFHIFLINIPFSDVDVGFSFELSNLDLLVCSSSQVGSPFSIGGPDLSFDLSFFEGGGFLSSGPESESEL